MKKLYGIGTGPGASDLITVRSARLIENADVIFAPNNKGKNMALDTVREYIKTENIIFLDFPMGKVGPEIYKESRNYPREFVGQQVRSFYYDWRRCNLQHIYKYSLFR